jgi:ADP-ribose pyrophosphatase
VSIVSVRRSTEVDDGLSPFLSTSHLVLRATFPDGTESEPFRYDIVARERLDAVVIAAHFRDEQGQRHVYLRSALRPPVALRPKEAWPVPEHDDLGNLWELPAGLVEEDERSPEGLLSCAARELHEELGFVISPDKLAPLGPSTFPAPGMVGERHFFFHVEVDPKTRVEPPEDGSVLERGAAIAAIPLDEALALARKGVIEDEKTELGLRRLAELEG